MTVFELMINLSKYPGDFKVVIDKSCDYEEYGEVNSMTPVKFGCWDDIDRESKDKNAIFLS